MLYMIYKICIMIMNYNIWSEEHEIKKKAMG